LLSALLWLIKAGRFLRRTRVLARARRARSLYVRSSVTPCTSTSTETRVRSSGKSLVFTQLFQLRFDRTTGRPSFLTMSRGLTILVLAITIFSPRANFAATSVKQDPRRLSEEEAHALATYAPMAQYPFQARAKHLQGAGMVRLDVDRRTGYVTSARTLQSTGHQILDDAAIKAFQAWRFQPGSVSAVRIPVRFVVMGSPQWPQTVDPKYPREARDRGLTGRGVAEVKVDPRTGYVTASWMLKSTGRQILDNAAVEAFRKWRFRPRTVTAVEVPVQFTTKGISYYTKW
jgi:TonB family protein